MKRYLVLAVLLTLVACREQDGLNRSAGLTLGQHWRATTRLISNYPGFVCRSDRTCWSGCRNNSGHAPAAGGQQHPFLADPLSGDLQAQAGRQLALGSGVIVEPNGIILTNHHLMDGSDSIVVELVDRRVFAAKVLCADPPSDLAVLKIEARSLPALSLGDSDRVRVGDVALAIGNPLGIGQTVTAGIISAKGRSTGFSNGSFEDFLQTDAPINQGNSGGALINARGS